MAVEATLARPAASTLVFNSVGVRKTLPFSAVQSKEDERSR